MLYRLLITITTTLWFAHGVFSIPTEFKPIVKAKNGIEEKNKAKIDAAKALVDKNTLKMEYVLKNPKVPAHKEIIDAAFGTDDSLSMRHIKKTVRGLKTGTVPVDLATDPTHGDSHAVTHYVGERTPMKPTHVGFTKKFYAAKTSNDARAATLVHEATHYLSNTGDYIEDNKILPGNDVRITKNWMYTKAKALYKTPAELNRDKLWTKHRDGTGGYWGTLNRPAVQDMHKAAEAYAQFSSMCGHAIPDAVVNVHRPRSMEDQNWDEVAIHLIRRHACSRQKVAADNLKAAAQGKASSRIASAKSRARVPNNLVKSKTGALSPKSGSKVAVGNPKSKSQNLSKGRTTKVTAQGLGIVRASASIKRPQLKVSASKLSVKTGQAPKRIVGRPVSSAPAKSSSKSSLRPVPKSTLLTVAKSSAKRTVPPKAVVPKVVPKQVGTQKKVRRDLTSRF